MPGYWYQVACQLPADCVDVVAERLAELSGTGVCTDNRSVDTFSADDIPEQPLATVTCWFEESCPIEQHLATITELLRLATVDRLGFTPAPPECRRIGSEDWAESWKEHFKPMLIGSRLVIAPSWEQHQADTASGRIGIVLDPGMAFGTGGHETTRLCLECLELLMDEAMNRPVLDLGTGSGILAIAAAKLGAATVDAVDIDRQAVAIAEENCRVNQVDDRVRCSATPLHLLPGGYGIILANILAEELVRLAPELVARVAPGGSLILSGILAEREQYVLDRFADVPMRLITVLRDNEWRCIQYRRES